MVPSAFSWESCCLFLRVFLNISATKLADSEGPW